MPQACQRMGLELRKVWANWRHPERFCFASLRKNAMFLTQCVVTRMNGAEERTGCSTSRTMVTKNQGITEDQPLHMSQQCYPDSKRATTLLGCVSRQAVKHIIAPCPQGCAQNGASSPGTAQESCETTGESPERSSRVRGLDMGSENKDEKNRLVWRRSN